YLETPEPVPAADATNGRDRAGTAVEKHDAIQQHCATSQVSRRLRAHLQSTPHQVPGLRARERARLHALPPATNHERTILHRASRLARRPALPIGRDAP